MEHNCVAVFLNGDLFPVLKLPFRCKDFALFHTLTIATSSGWTRWGCQPLILVGSFVLYGVYSSLLLYVAECLAVSV